MATGAVHVTGLRELNRAFKKMSGDLDKEMKASLREAASPVKDLAEQFALGGIRNMPRSPDWSLMRVGVSAKAVYIVPQQRGGRGSSRPNLKGLLLRMMDTALERKQAEVVEGVGKMIDKLSGASGF